MSKPSDIDRLNFSDNAFMDYNETQMMDEDMPIKKASIYYVRDSKHNPKGKTALGNDCLYNCLVTVFDRKGIMQSPEKLKEFLRVDRNDGVHIDKIPLIEHHMHCNIRVAGSHTYQGCGKYPRSVTLNIWNGHYQRVYQIDDFQVLRKGYYTKKGTRPYPCVYRRNQDKNTITWCYYDQFNKGNKIVEEHPISVLGQFYKDEKYHKGNRLFLYLMPKTKKKDEKGEVMKYDNGKPMYVMEHPRDVLDTIINKFKEFQRVARLTLGEKASGSLDPLRSHGSYRILGSQYWSKVCPKTISNCDPFMVDNDAMLCEDYWLKQSMIGGNLYAKKNTVVEEAYEYDLNSAYVYFLKQTDFITRKGKFKNIKQLPKKFNNTNLYSIYHCTINGYDNKIFQKNSRPGDNRFLSLIHI